MIIETLKSLQPLLITTLIILGLIVFRTEVKKLVDWIVTFKKFAKTKNGYQASIELEPRGISPEPRKELTEEKVMQSIDSVKQPEEERKREWIDAFVEEKYDKAGELLKDRIEAEKDEHTRVQLNSILGYIKFMKDKKIGVEYFEEIIREQEATIDTYAWYALSYKKKENYETAIAIAKRGIDAFKDSPRLYELYADCLIPLNREMEAIEFLAETLRLYPERASHYVKIADILIQLGMKDLAKDCCKAGINLCPTDISLLEKYGEIAAKMEEYKEAMNIYLKLTNKEPDKPVYWTLLGNQYLMLSLNDLALEAYKKGNQLASEKQGWIVANIGNIMKNVGFATEGASYLKKAIVINPDYQYAHERLAQALKLSEEEWLKRDQIDEEVGRKLRVSGGGLDAVITSAKEKQSKLIIESKMA